MSAGSAKLNRDDLLREIFGTLRQWSELERNIFSRAHYYGQSLEAISRSLKLNKKEVDAILRQCDLQLYSSLREFRKNCCGKHPDVHAETATMAARRKGLNSGHGLSSKTYKNPGTSRIAI